MAEPTDNLVLELLRQIRNIVGNIEGDVQDLKLRMSAVETHVATLHASVAQLNTRMDRFDERLARVERGLGLVEA